MKTKPYTHFCGIDVAKRSHVACVIDGNNQFVVRSQSFSNDAQGYQALLQRLQDAA